MPSASGRPGVTGGCKPSSGDASSWSTSVTDSRRLPDTRWSLSSRHRCTHESISSRPPALRAVHIIELELVEPELFFRLAPHAATRMAQLLPHHEPRRDTTP